METFCCANKVETNNQDNQNPNDIINPPTQTNLPSTEIFAGTDLNKILQINSNDMNDKPFSNY